MSADRDAPKPGEMSSLNADRLDLGQLDEQELEDVAGGAMGSCGTFDCGTYSVREN